MVTEKLTPSEQAQANTILAQMGLNESEKYKDDIEYTLNHEFDTHREFYENDNIVDKPESVKIREKKQEAARRGQIINGEGLKPLKNNLIMKMKEDREKTTKGGIILADLRPVKQDNANGVVVALNDNTEYDFKIGDHIVIDLKYIKHRYNYKDEIHLILDKDGVLGVYE